MTARFYVLFGLIPFLFLVSGCANSSEVQFIDDFYKTKKEPYTKVFVLPLNDKIKIKNSIADSLAILNNEFPNATQREKEVFDNYFKLLLKEKTQSNVVNVEQNIPVNTANLIEKEAVVGSKKIQFKIPDIKSLLVGKEQLDYLMMFDELSFLKDFAVTGSSLGRSGETFYTLKIGFEYLIWDCKLNIVAAYGRINQETKLLLVPQKEDFLVVLDKLADSLIQKSPFVKKKIYF